MLWQSTHHRRTSVVWTQFGHIMTMFPSICTTGHGSSSSTVCTSCMHQLLSCIDHITPGAITSVSNSRYIISSTDGQHCLFHSAPKASTFVYNVTVWLKRKSTSYGSCHRHHRKQRNSRRHFFIVSVRESVNADRYLCALGVVKSRTRVVLQRKGKWGTLSEGYVVSEVL